MSASKKFDVGEIAVLFHGDGARLFEVFADDGESVTERYQNHGQQKYALKVRYWQLCKVKNAKAAQELVDLIATCKRDRDERMNTAKATFERQMRLWRETWEINPDDTC